MKNRYVLLADLPLIAIAAFGAFAARFDLMFYQYRSEFIPFVIAALVIKPVVFLLCGMYRRYWRYASIQELFVVLIGVSAASTAMMVFIALSIMLGYYVGEFSRVVVFNDWLMTLATAGGVRLAIRVAHESGTPAAGARRAADARRILIVGAGAAGTLVVREMRRNPQLRMQPVGFLDDDAAKVGKYMAGLRVLGQTAALRDVVHAHSITNVIIAMPTARGPAVRAILDMCNDVGLKSQTIPGVFELLDGQVSINRLRNVEITDLLRRSPVGDPGNTASFVTNRVVLITGGGGSIGCELARQVANAAPSHLVVLGRGENSIFEAESILREAFPDVRLSTVIADIRDEPRLASVFDRVRPDIVFHAAAHKHVPLMELNPEEAVTNNIIGTRNVVNQALRTGTERLVLISTDKAVAPSSTMGATKRIAEMIVRRAAQTSGRAFVAVRFGNVLGSRGSVVSTFKQQIERGGPVTVTHPDMTRFFMTIPEAVHLVLQASGRGKGGELFVLDMGEPVKVVQLAQDLIKLSGLHEDDIRIVFTGRRPGEKLEERLVEPNAQICPTSHPEVLQVVGSDAFNTLDLDAAVAKLADAASRSDRATIETLLHEIIPDFARTANASDTPRTRMTGSNVH